MPTEATVPEVKPENPAVPTTPGQWLAYATGKWGIGGACVALAVIGLCYIYGDLRSATQQMVTDQKQASTENLKVVVQAVEAINTNTNTMEKVGDSVEANTKATEEIARDVRELREELRREK